MLTLIFAGYIILKYLIIYMNEKQALIKDEPKKYHTHFSEYIKDGFEPDNIEDFYKKVQTTISANPNPTRNARQPPSEHMR